MREILQILQIGFFALPVLGLLLLGVLMMIKPVLIFHRRLFLLILIPFLLANPLALIETYILPEDTPSPDWRLWLVLVVDILLVAVGYRLLSGWLVYGLSEEKIETTLQDRFEAQGWEFRSSSRTRSTWWGGKRPARYLEASRGDHALTFWLLSQGSEIRLEGTTQEADIHLHKALPTLRRVEKPDQSQEHLTGLLFIVLAVVLAVLAWIFFFEPRLILIE